MGEPAANPYLFIASQIVAGLDGVNGNAAPWAPDDEPYEADRPRLPASLADALLAAGASKLFREAFGPIYLDYFVALKRAELVRYAEYVVEHGDRDDDNGISRWEQNEYFDFF